MGKTPQRKLATNYFNYNHGVETTYGILLAQRDHNCRNVRLLLSK